MMLTQELDKKMFIRDIKKVGLPGAQRKQKARAVYQTSMKFKPSVCRQCVSALLCGVCSHGGWLI